ncbi:hypothetical protein BJ546DRAFT_1059174 [Cryomyces antarcticus]|nr:hypothetical protein LTR39_002009 [Cryomyces antarcticus]KAK5018659.1 hypothetical protein LTR60_001409 [Cryomyces antarcticus]KAK5139228.1 hypothetical protein LTR04_003769 [Oleoguttula sp. CCFEE 6159]
MVVYYEIAGRKFGSHVVSAPDPPQSASTPLRPDSKQPRTTTMETASSMGTWLTLVAIQLAMATLGTTFLGAFAAMGGSKASQQSGPPINATSKDEEKFIQEFMQNAEAEEKKEKAKH